MSEINDKSQLGNGSTGKRGSSLLGRLFGHEHALVVACAIIGAAVGVYRLCTLTPQYVASARLYVEPADAIGNADSGQTTDSKTPAAWVPPTDLLMGTEIGGLAVQIGNLQSLPCFSTAADLPLHIVTNLDVKTSPAQSGQGQIQDLRFISTDRKAAEQVLESLISAYEITAERWRTQRISDSLGALEKQRTLLSERLQQKQRELQRFRESNPSAFRASDSLVLDSRLKALVEARIRAEIRRIEAEVRLATMQATASPDSADAERPASATTRPSDAAIDVTVLNNLLPRAKADDGHSATHEILSGSSGQKGPATVVANSPTFADALPPAEAIDLDAETQYVHRLEETWGPDHPKLRAAKTRLAELERKVRGQASRSIRTAEAYFRFCRDEEERLQKAIDAQRTAASPNVGENSAVQVQILQQVVDRSGKLLAAVCERIDRLSLQSATSGVAGIKITTVVPPNAMPRVTSDQTPKLFLVPTGIGLLIGFALIYLRGPKAAPQTTSMRAGGTSLRPVSRKDAVLGLVPPLPRDGGRGSQRALGTWVLRESDSKAAKAFRRLGKRLVQAVAKAEARCVLVSSAEPREGKSVVMANVATAIAQTGRKVLLIDANYDHPSQHILLSDILSLALDNGGDNAAEISVEAIERGRLTMRTQIETLWVVPAWPKPARPMEILESLALREFVRQSASKYDIILIDAPALTERVEIELLAELADAALYVANATNANPQHERELLRRLDLPAVGLVMNTVPAIGGTRTGSQGPAARSQSPVRPSVRRSVRRDPASDQPDDSDPATEAQAVGSDEGEPPSEPSY